MNKNLTPEQRSRMLKELRCVITVPMVCELWNKTRKSVMNQIYTEGLISEQQGKIHLVHVDSVYLLWGDPTESEKK